MDLKSRDPKKTYLGLLLNVHTKFQLYSSISRGDREGTAYFQGHKGEISISPLLINLGS